MKINFKTCTEEELWKYVAVHLKKHNVDSILVGGAVVSIYSEGAYESGDLDFVLTDMFVKNLPAIMKEIGFEKKVEGITSILNVSISSSNFLQAF